MSYNCEILERTVQPVLAVRTRTPASELPQVLGRAYQAIVNLLGELEEDPAGPPYTAYFNMDMQNLDVEIGFPVSQKLKGRGEVIAGEIPAGSFASCLHTGPYSEIKSAYQVLMQWVVREGHEATGVSYEFYLNDPNQTPPEELMTQIVFPLKPGRG